MEMTPKEVVAYLDNYIVGQEEAKKAIAIALRNRYRRLKLDPEIRDEVVPKNILMIGPTGVGKTEIARRMAKMMSLPFVKVEATKYTEVGFVGRDVESMVRDLVIDALKIVKEEHRERNVEKIRDYVLDTITARLVGPLPDGADETKKSQYDHVYDKMKARVASGEMDDRTVVIETSGKPPSVEVLGGNDMAPELMKLQESFSKMLSGMNSGDLKKEVTVGEAKTILEGEAADKLLDMDLIRREAVERAESSGIIFIDEMDKVAVSHREGSRQDPSKEGVQRDLLPIVEGSAVTTKYGVARTDHVLFIAAGAFHISKPSDLQGRFPLRVELSSLDEEALYQILTTTKNSILRQYEALLGVEEVELVFEDDAVRLMAKLAQKANEKTEDIGARRLHTIIEKVLEEISFAAEEHKGETVRVTADLVHKTLDTVVANEDYTRYIL